MTNAKAAISKYADVAVGSACRAAAYRWDAAGWGVWLHGQAGLAAQDRIGPIGFLARDLILEIPRLMARPPV